MRARYLALLACMSVGWLILQPVILTPKATARVRPVRKLPPHAHAALKRNVTGAQRSEGALLWSLQHAVALQVVKSPLQCYYGYERIASGWDAWELIRPLIKTSGYVWSSPATLPPLIRSGRQPSEGTDYERRAQTSGPPPLIIVPNYWREGAEDWRTFRLAPFQRINRFWGMEAISKKDQLVTTLGANGSGPSFMPQSYLWQGLRHKPGWQSTVAAQPRWVLKSTLHRGQGVSIVATEQLLSAARGEGERAVRTVLSRPDTIVQQARAGQWRRPTSTHDVPAVL